jgi:cytochrome P450
MAISGVPTLNFSTTDPEFVADPWPRYAQIAELGGVVFNEHINHAMVSGFDDVRQILTTPTHFGSEKGQDEHAAVFGGPTMEFYDGPHHDQMRSIWSDGFRPKTLSALRPMITDVVRRRLAPVLTRLRDGESVEAISELTRGIPTEVIARMLGVQPAMVGEFSAWSDAMGAAAEGYAARVSTAAP